MSQLKNENETLDLVVTNIIKKLIKNNLVNSEDIKKLNKTISKELSRTFSESSSIPLEFYLQQEVPFRCSDVLEFEYSNELQKKLLENKMIYELMDSELSYLINFEFIDKILEESYEKYASTINKEK